MKEKNTNIKTGLTRKEVATRISQNLVNSDTNKSTKTVKTIIRENVITLFNIINVILAIAVILVGSFKNLTFIIIIILNTLISIFQELRSKKTLDNLKIMNEVKVKALRDSKIEILKVDEIVLDDILLFDIGSSVVVDSIIKDGEVEVDESFITGEADTVYKKEGDLLLSGSFIVSGKCICQVKHIGMDNYTAKISSDTKYIKPVSSEIMRSLQKIVETISFLIVPVGILLFSRQLFLEGNTITQAVVSTVAALIGMIPEGLVLLTSTVLAVSVIRLSRRKVLVQDLYCIETLARVDTICLDKTGTITEGKMEVVDIINKSKENLNDIVGTIAYALNDNNPTAISLRDYFKDYNKLQVTEKIYFSSKNKYSGIVVNDKTYMVGALEFILKGDIIKYKKEIAKYTKEYRALVIVEKKKTSKVLGYILLRDKIRKEAHDTLEFFRNNNVSVKIISGDDPNTVLNIAKRAGLDSSAKAIDASTLKNDEDIIKAVNEYTVFGRVTPLQKKDFIIALQNSGHTVAMTGDGVNDVLALKEADCSVAMASGVDAVKNVSQLVLLDSNFASMPEVVREGRRTINNIERSASLFLVKTVYATLLSIIFIFIEMPYPFIPIQLTLTSVVTIGIPSFVLALEPNKELVKGKFLENVLKKAIPPAITIVLNILVIFIAANFTNLEYEKISTLAVVMTSYTSFILLYKICQPFNKLRLALFLTMFTAFCIGLVTLKNLFSFAHFDITMIIICIVCVLLSHYLYNLVDDTLNNVINYRNRKKVLKS